jgi:ribonuclease HI
MKRSELASLVIYSDGGCRNNGNGNGSGSVHCYGSYMVVATDKQGVDTVVKSITVDWPDLHTNNEAEYEALHIAATYIDAVAREAQLINVPITFRIDSKLVFDQLNGGAKCKAANLAYYHTRVSILIDELSAKLERVSGEHMKTVLGH